MPAASGQAQTPGGTCRAESARIRLDHVVIAVRDLDSASRAFHDTLGFSLKPGRVHENGLKNEHIRFQDGSALELITTGPGQPDGLSEWYRRFLANGDGGAFLALRAGPPDSVLGHLGTLAGDALVFEGPAFDWVSFPQGHPLHPIFFVHVRRRPADEPGQLRHRNGTTGLAEVWVEVGKPEILARVLGEFGATLCGDIVASDGQTGQGYGLADGMLVALPTRPGPQGGRVIGVVLDAEWPSDAVRSAGVWLRWRAEAR